MFSNFFSYLATTQWHRFALGLFLCLLGIGFGIGFGVLSADAKNSSQEDYNRRLAIFTEWQMKVSTTFTRASTLAASAGTFAKSTITTPANLTASVLDRVKLINPPAFDQIFADLFAEVPGISSVQLQSGGVISQMWPKNSTTLHFDVLNSPGFNAVYDKLMDEGNPLTAGPMVMTGVQAGYGLFVRYPVFVGALKNRSTFWGVGTVLIKVHELMLGLKIESNLAKVGIDYAMWFDSNGTSTLIAQTGVSYTATPATYTPAPDVKKVMNDGMRMQLPVSEPGKVTYLAMYPRGDPVSDKMKTGDVVAVVIATVIGAAFLLVLMYVILYAIFRHHHRFAPRKGETVFASLITLRGAQVAVERSPAESARMFAEFTRIVHSRAETHCCYVVCDVGDRSVYIVARHASSLLALGQEVAGDVVITGNVEGDETQSRQNQNASVNFASSPYSSSQYRGSPLAAPNSRSILPENSSPAYRSAQVVSSQNNSFAVGSRLQQITVGSNVSGEVSAVVNNSSIVTNVVMCRPSAVLTILPEGPRIYDSETNVYFFSTAPQLSKLGAFSDQVKMGDIGWCSEFGKYCEENSDAADALKTVCESLFPPDTSLEEDTRGVRTICDDTKARRAIMYALNLLEDSSRNANADDPTMAMVVLNDSYVCAMTERAHISRRDFKTARRNANKRNMNNNAASSNNQDGGDGVGGNIGDMSLKSTVKESTYISRSATILCIWIHGDPRAAIDTIRRIVSEERGIVVSATGQNVVAAFNLMTPSGRHQLKAADTVARLRAALLDIPFVCAISDGRVGAMVSDGLVMCMGEVVAVCEDLLSYALNIVKEKRLKETDAVASNIPLPSRTLFTMSIHHAGNGDSDNDDALLTSSGLCLLLCQSEVSSSYDCEAIDVFAHGARKTKILYQLCARKGLTARADVGISKSENKQAMDDDEWMYCLKDDDTVFGPVNTLFQKIGNGEIEEARRMWKQLLAAEATALASGNGSAPVISDVGRDSLHRLLSE